MLPRVVKKMRKVDGDASMMEECLSLSFPFPPLSLTLIVTTDYDMLFADDETSSTPASVKFLELAHAFAAKKAAAAALAASAPAQDDDDDDDDDEDDDDEDEEEGAKADASME